MNVLGCLLSLLLVGFFIILGFGISIMRAFLRLFGIDILGPKHSGPEIQTPNEPQRQRVFDENDGEYIDFEEV